MIGSGGFFWGIINILVGILIIVFPALLRWIVGIYLIVVGLSAVFRFTPPF